MSTIKKERKDTKIRFAYFFPGALYSFEFVLLTKVTGKGSLTWVVESGLLCLEHRHPSQQPGRSPIPIPHYYDWARWSCLLTEV